MTYFLEGPVVSYDDLLRNDIDLFIGYRRELMKDGIFELPLNLKRSHFSYAHTDEDVDRLLDGDRGRGHALPGDPRVSDSPVSCSIDLTGPGKSVGHLAFPKITNTAGWASTHVHIASIGNGDGPTVLVLGGNHGDEYEGQVAALRLLQELQPEQVSGRVIIIPVLSPAASKANTRNWPSGANFNRSFPGRPDGPANEQLADFLTRDAVSARRRGHRHALGWTHGLVHPVLAHARRRRSRPAQGDARGHGGVEQRLPLPLHRRQRHRASCPSRPRTRARS